MSAIAFLFLLLAVTAVAGILWGEAGLLAVAMACSWIAVIAGLVSP